MLRAGPNMIVFNEYESFKQICVPNPNPVKTTRYAAVNASHTPNLVSSNHQPTVKMKRKTHLDMRNSRNLQKAEPRFHALISTFLSLMAPGSGSDATAATDSWSPAIDLSDLGKRFGFDTLLSMGKAKTKTSCCRPTSTGCQPPVCT